jgi:hypothetical protein
LSSDLELWLAPWSGFVRYLLDGWVPSDLDAPRYPGWRCPLERHLSRAAAPCSEVCH